MVIQENKEVDTVATIAHENGNVENFPLEQAKLLQIMPNTLREIFLILGN